MRSKVSDKKGSIATPSKAGLKRHVLPILVILFFFISSYLIISSDYNHVHADAGSFARHAKVLYEKNEFDITGSATATIGQLLFSNIFCHIFGFRFKVLHISVYVVNFLVLIGMYLLLLELGLDRFLALFGSLALLINPISLRMIDWYLTEPFFMFYLVFSILFFIKAFQSWKYINLYIGSVFCIFAILTRQHAISVPFSLILLCIIYRKKLPKSTFFHSVISSILPLLSIGLFYLYVFSKSIGKVPAGFSPSNLALMKRFLNPLFLFLRSYFDSLFFLHYIALYLTPLFILLFWALLMNPKKIKDLNSKSDRISIISILFVSVGSIILYVKDNKRMPYKPSIFSINHLTKIFNFSITDTNKASLILTLFTWIGAVIVLMKVLDYFFTDDVLQPLLSKRGKKGEKRTDFKNKDKQVDFGNKFFYLWGICHILVTILIGLRYDRYIFPVSILMIYVVLSNFAFIGEQKKAFIVVFTLIYSIFIFKVASLRLSLDLQWKANYYLTQEGIDSHEINGGLGFNYYYNFEYINNLYKNAKINRPINWYKFHPLANFFVRGKRGLENKHPGVLLYKSFTQKRLFGLLERTCFIYKRKKGYKKAIWL